MTHSAPIRSLPVYGLAPGSNPAVDAEVILSADQVRETLSALDFYLFGVPAGGVPAGGVVLCGIVTDGQGDPIRLAACASETAAASHISYQLESRASDLWDAREVEMGMYFPLQLGTLIYRPYEGLSVRAAHMGGGQFLLSVQWAPMHQVDSTFGPFRHYWRPRQQWSGHAIGFGVVMALLDHYRKLRRTEEMRVSEEFARAADYYTHLQRGGSVPPAMVR